MTQALQLEVNKFYAVYYDTNWYIGSIESIIGETSGETIRIKFLRQKKAGNIEGNIFYWPKKADSADVDKEFIFYGPVCFASDSDGNQNFQLTKDEYETISLAYTKKKLMVSSSVSS